MTVAPPREDTAPDIRTPTAARALRRAAFWIVAVVLVIGVAVLIVAGSRSGTAGTPLDPDNPAPQGARAVAEVLRQQGVTVTVTRSLPDTLAAISAAGAGSATVVLSDPQLILGPAAHAQLDAAAADLVLLAPDIGTLADLAPGVFAAGTATLDGPVGGCGIRAVERAGSISASGATYRATGTPGAVSCLLSGDQAGLVRLTTPAGTRTVLGLESLLQNDTITRAGDAALALGLLGAHPTLVWYQPGTDDLRGSVPPTIAELTPPWVTPLVALAGVVALTAILWRGRRMGRLVIENLPVPVRSRETMEGRARLYERSGARLHALDQLRMAAVARLARTLGLPRTTPVGEVADAVAATTGRPRAEVAGILLDRIPGGDAELVALSDALARLERETRERSRPGGAGTAAPPTSPTAGGEQPPSAPGSAPTEWTT